MKRVFTILLAIGLFSCFALHAERRSMSEVMRLANSVLPTQKAKRCLSSREVNNNSSTESFYILKAEAESGFVIVSADDRMPAILAYSTTESFPDDMPEHVRAFLDTYNQALKRVEEGASADEVFPMFSAKEEDYAESVEPLLGDILYDQGAPFNLKCPTESGRNTVTGCVATAMAQIMRYYQYPSSATGTFTVSNKTNGKQTTYDLSKLPLDWSLIRENYLGEYTQKEGEAVANLMIAAGAAAGLIYGLDATSGQTENARKALVNTFGYTDALYAGVTNLDKPYDDWIRQFVIQFRAGHPILFGGAPGSNGHAFVIDGYRTNIKGIDDATPMDMLEEEDVSFHVNWGWSGKHNGWFYLGHLQPEQDNYSGYRWEMVYNIVAPGWVGVDNIEQHTRLSQGDIFNILGQKVGKAELQPGQIYIQDGKKVIYGVPSELCSQGVSYGVPLELARKGCQFR